MDQKEVAVKEAKASCSDSRKLAEEFIQEKVVSSNLICMSTLNLHRSKSALLLYIYFTYINGSWLKIVACRCFV